jgi:hypothetical protein
VGANGSNPRYLLIRHLAFSSLRINLPFMYTAIFSTEKAKAIRRFQHVIKCIFALMMLLSTVGLTNAQPWSYDFGTGTGTANNSNSGSGNTSFFTSTPSNGGTYRVRIGTQGGSLVLANPGTSLGSGTEVQLTAATGGSSNKFTVYNWDSPTTDFYLKFKMRTTSSGNGVQALHIGSGAGIFTDNNGYTSYNISIATLLINYSGGSISSVQRRFNGSNVTISSSGIAINTDHDVEIYANNSSASTSYIKDGSNSLSAQSWDLWIDGTKISPSGGWGKSGTWAAGSNIAGFGFFGESSTSNAAVLYLDDLEYSNSFAAPTSFTAAGTLSALSTEYGTASSNTSFTLEGSNLTTGISVNPPAGFEVATTSNFSTTIGTNGNPLVVGSSGNLALTTVYVRLAATAPPGSYSGNIVCSTTGAANQDVATAASTVDTKELTVSGVIAENKTFDGNNTATLDLSSASLNGIIGSDDVELDASSLSATFDDENAGEDKPVTVSGLALNGVEANRYTLTQPTGLTADIEKANQSITFNPLAAKDDNDDPFELTATASSGLAVSYTSSDPSVATVLGTTVTIVGEGSTTITASQAGNANYNPATDVDQILVVTSASKLNQTITFNALSNVTYGDAPFALTATASSGLDVSYISSNTDVATITGSTVTIVGAGSTNITATQDGDDDYNPAEPVIQSLTVDPKTLTVTAATAADKEYDGNTDAVVSVTSFTGTVGSDDVAVDGAGTFASAGIGTGISVTPSFSISGADAANYEVDQNVAFSLSADITSKVLSISGAAADAKIYDGNTSTTASGTLNGVVSGDDVSIGGATFVSAAAGTGISATIFLSGTDAGNYVLDGSANVTADITPKALTLTGASAEDKEYDRTVDATITGTLTGVIGSDDVSVNLSGTFNNFDAGTAKPVTSTSSLAGTDATNYSLTQPTGLTADISPKELTLAGATALDKSFDGSTSADIEGSLSGIIAPDVVDFSFTANFNNPNVGTDKPVTANVTLIGADASNYSLAAVTGLTADITVGICSGTLSASASWNFTTADISSTPITGLTISEISRGNNNGTSNALLNSTSASNISGTSGGNNAGVAARIGALNTGVDQSAYFEFTLTPGTDYSAQLTSITFASRSTSTGPQAYAVRSSADGYAANIGSGTISNNATWAFTTAAIDPLNTGLGEEVTFRIYGFNGTGSPGANNTNWRIDDLSLAIELSLVPEITSDLSAAVCSGTPFDYTPESSSASVDITWTRATVSGISNAAVTTPQSGSINETLINTTGSPVVVTYVLTLSTGNCEISENLAVTVNPVGTPMSIGQISGDAFQGCDGVAGAPYSVASVSGATTYTWSTTGGITIASGQGTINATFDFPVGFTTGQIRVQASNPCQQSTTRVLTVRSTPAGVPGAISGTTSNICGGTSESYAVNPVGNADGYEWIIAGTGATINGSNTGAGIDVDFAEGFTSAIIQVRAVNDCGISGWRSLAVSSGTDALGIPGAISGPTQGCPSSPETYSIPAIAGATEYIWRATNGIIISGGQGSNSAEMTFPAGFLSGSIFVKAANACGQTREVRINVTGLTRAPGAIAGQTTLVCANSSKLYSIAPVAGASSYIWSATGDITLNSDNGLEATFDFGPSFVSGTIEVQAVNACGPSAVRKLTVRSNVPARPGVISGIAAGLCVDESTTYSINPVNFADNYIWSFAGDLEVTSVQGGGTSATYTAGPGFETGQVIVQAENACGISLPRTLNVRSTPARPGAITGPGPDVVKGSSGLGYSISPVASATSYNWSGTNGIDVVSGNGTTTISVDIPSEFISGLLSVSAVNACGEGPVRGRAIRGIEDLPFMRGAIMMAPEISIYPNPIKDKVIVQGSGISEIHLYDLSGKLLQAHRYQDAYQEEIILNYPQGMYIIQVFGAGWNTQHKVVVAQ